MSAIASILIATNSISTHEHTLTILHLIDFPLSCWSDKRLRVGASKLSLLCTDCRHFPGSPRATRIVSASLDFAMTQLQVEAAASPCTPNTLKMKESFGLIR